MFNLEEVSSKFFGLWGFMTPSLKISDKSCFSATKRFNTMFAFVNLFWNYFIFISGYLGPDVDHSAWSLLALRPYAPEVWCTFLDILQIEGSIVKMLN